VTAAQSTRVGPGANGDAAAGGEANGAAIGHGNGNGNGHAAADMSDAELAAAGAATATVVATLSALRSTASHPPPLARPCSHCSKRHRMYCVYRRTGVGCCV
jgi:hypothetical protein